MWCDEMVLTKSLLPRVQAARRWRCEVRADCCDGGQTIGVTGQGSTQVKTSTPSRDLGHCAVGIAIAAYSCGHCRQIAMIVVIEGM